MLYKLRHVNPIILTVFGMIAVVLFTLLDQALSGGSAQDPIYAAMFLIAGGVALFLLAGDSFGYAGRIIGILLGASPFLFVGGTIAINATSALNANHKAQQNAECAVEAAGIPPEHAKFVRMRLRQMQRHPSIDVDIENRLNITILPNCEFKRRAPKPLLQSKPKSPEVQFEKYVPPPN